MASFDYDGKSYKRVSDFDVQTLLGSSGRILQLPTDGSPFPPPRAIIADAPGTATITPASNVDPDPVTLDGFPLTGGEQSIFITAITNVTGATNVFGLY